MRIKKHILISGLVIMALLGGCTKETPIERIEQVKQVNVVTIDRTYQKETVNYLGFITSKLIIPIVSDQAGQIETIHVNQGERVTAGDPLVTARALDTSEQIMYAPFDGVVVDVFLKEDDLFNQQTPLLLVRDEHLVVEIGVTSDDFKKIKNEALDKVELTINGLLKQGSIDQMSQVPDSNSRLYTVLVKIKDDKNLLLGDMARVTFSLSGVNGIWLPISRILNDGEDYVLIVNTENRVERRNLKLLSLNNDVVRVEGLKAGDRVISVGYSNVKEGQLVNAREALDDKVD